MILLSFCMVHILLVLFQDILRSQHFLDSIVQATNLENSVQLIIPEKISSELHSGKKRTFPYLIFCQNFAYSILGLLFSKAGPSSDWKSLVKLGYRDIKIVASAVECLLCWYVRCMRCPSMERRTLNLILYFPRCGVKTFPEYWQKTCAVIHLAGLCPTPMSSGTLFVISYAILLHQYSSIHQHNTPEARKVSTTVMYASARPLPNPYTFLTPLHAVTFPGSG